MNDKTLQAAAGRFFRAFRFVFEDDWSHSQVMLEYWKSYPGESVNFLDPHLDDDGLNWSNRAILIKAFHDLSDELARRGESLEGFEEMK